MKRNVIWFTLSVFVAVILVTFSQDTSFAQETTQPAKTEILKVYGPGGPAPAMREAAKVFGDRKGIKVEITAGPTPN